MLPDAEIPDLNTIPRDEWKAALKPFCEMDRRRAVGWIRGGGEALDEGLALIGYLMLEDRPPIMDIPTPRVPEGARVERPQSRPLSRVISFRLSPPQYTRIQALADELELKPNALARLMVVRGVDQALREREA